MRNTQITIQMQKTDIQTTQNTNDNSDGKNSANKPANLSSVFNAIKQYVGFYFGYIL